MDTWYDLAIRELSELTDPAKEKLADAPEDEDSVVLDLDACEIRR